MVEEDDEEEEEEEDELEDDEEEEVEDVLEVVEVVEDVLEVVEVVEDVLEEETLVEVVEELGVVVVDSVEDGGRVDETVCDWVLLVFGEPEVRTKYPPTAATITTTTIAPIIAVLNAVRLLRANEGKRSDVWFLRLIFKRPAIWALIRLVTSRFT